MEGGCWAPFALGGVGRGGGEGSGVIASAHRKQVCERWDDDPWLPHRGRTQRTGTTPAFSENRLLSK